MTADGGTQLRSGRLVVATPSLAEPTFFRTVVLLLDHDADGTLGVVLNRPSGVAVDEVLPGWGRLVTGSPVLYSGGPVLPGGIALARCAGPRPSGWTPVVGDLGTVDLELDPSAMDVAFTHLRLYSGYAGWSPGQLEDEIDAGEWFVVDHHRDDPFTDRPERLWPQVLRRQRGRLQLYATYPVEPARN